MMPASYQMPPTPGRITRHVARKMAQGQLETPQHPGLSGLEDFDYGLQPTQCELQNQLQTQMQYSLQNQFHSHLQLGPPRYSMDAVQAMPQQPMYNPAYTAYNTAYQNSGGFMSNDPLGLTHPHPGMDPGMYMGIVPTTLTLDPDLLLETPPTPRPIMKRPCLTSDDEDDDINPKKRCMQDTHNPASLDYRIDLKDLDANYDPPSGKSHRSLADAKQDTLNTPHHSPRSSPDLFSHAAYASLNMTQVIDNEPLMSPATPDPYRASRTPVKRPAPPPIAPPREKKKRKSSKVKDRTTIVKRQEELAVLQLGSKIYVNNSIKEMRDGTVFRININHFMAHDKLKLDFHNRLNLILGENGSGKSGILSAIILALGANAAASKHNTNLTDFIMKGFPSCTLEIYLSNFNGTLSKKKYGNVIGLKRSIVRNSGSSRHLIRHKDAKDTSGIWVALKKNSIELELVLSSLQIDYTNPLQVFTQHDSTTFLRNHDPTKLYELYDVATLAKVHRQVLEEVEENRKATHENLERKRNIIEEEEEVIQVKQKEYQDILSIESHEIECKNLSIEYQWALVIEDESSLSEIQSQADALGKELSFVDVEKQAYQEQLNQTETGQETDINALSELEDNFKSVRKNIEDKKLVLRNLTVEGTRIDTQIKTEEFELHKLQRDVETVQTDLKATTSSNERQKLNTDKGLAKLEVRITEANAELETLQNSKDSLENELEESRDMLQRKSDEHTRLMSELGTHEKEWNKIRADQNDKYGRLGENMKLLISKIKKTSWKGRTPVGPLGALFTVKSEYKEYFELVEYILHNKLNDFATTAPEDVKTLEGLISQVYNTSSSHGVPSIHHVPDIQEPIHLGSGKAKIHDYPVVLDTLKIPDPYVFRVLINMCDIERLVLMRTTSEACEAFKGVLPRKPEKCLGYTLEWDKFFPFPNYGSRAITQKMRNSSKRSILLMTKTDNASQVKEVMDRLKSEKKVLDAKLEAAKVSVANYVKSLNKCKRDIERKKNQIKDLKTEQWTMQNHKNESPKADVASNKEMIEESEKWMEERRRQIHELQLQKKKNDVVIREHLMSLQELEQQMATLQTSIASSKNQKEEKIQKCNQLKNALANCDKKTKKLTAERNSLLKELNKVSESLAENLKAAEKEGPRVETRRDPKVIQVDLHGRKENFKRNKHKLLNRDKVKRELDTLTKHVGKMRFEINGCTHLQEALEPLVKIHWDLLRSERDFRYQTVQQNFTALVERRGYKGKLTIDFDTGQLHTYIAKTKEAINNLQTALKNIEDEQAAGREAERNRESKVIMEYTRGLSGGEKSYTTVCLLAALRQTMLAPFYLMDEVDTCMDVGNAKAALDILLEQSQLQPEAQFFNITHTNIDHIEPDDRYLNIIRLKKLNAPADTPRLL